MYNLWYTILHHMLCIPYTMIPSKVFNKHSTWTSINALLYSERSQVCLKGILILFSICTSCIQKNLILEVYFLLLHVHLCQKISNFHLNLDIILITHLLRSREEEAWSIEPACIKRQASILPNSPSFYIIENKFNDYFIKMKTTKDDPPMNSKTNPTKNYL